MSKFELHRKNSYGNVIVATFEHKEDMDKFIYSSPLKEGYGYFYVEIQELRTRYSINGW